MRNKSQWMVLGLTLLLGIASGAVRVWGAAPAPLPETAAAAASAPATVPATLPAPAIPLADIITRSESTLANMRALDTQLSTATIVETVEDELPELTRDIDARLDDSTKLLQGHQSLDTLRTIESAWSNLAEKTAEWKAQLALRGAAIDQISGRLQAESETWNSARAATQAAATRAATRDVYDQASKRIVQAADAVAATKQRAEAARSNVDRLEALVAVQQARIAGELTDIRRARDELLNHLFVQDAPPLWSSQTWRQAAANPADQQGAIEPQWRALGAYVDGQSGRFIAHAVIIGILLAGLVWARRRFALWTAEEPSLAAAAPVFSSPLSTAIVLAMLMSIWLHPQAPRLFWTITSGVAILPAMLLIRRLTDRHLHPLLYVLMALYFLDQVRSLTASLRAWPRFSLLVETATALGFLAWYLYSERAAKMPLLPAQGQSAEAHPGALESTRAKAEAAEAAAAENGARTSARGGPSVTHLSATHRRGRLLRAICRLSAAILAGTLVANVVGFVALATFAGHAFFRSAYLALIFYAFLAVTDGVIILILHVRPIRKLAAVRHHSTLIRARCRRIFGWGAVLLWGYVLLNILNVREPVMREAHYILGTPFGLGELTLGHLLKGVITIWASFAISRLIRFLLQEDVYPHVRLPRGLGAAFSSLIHYGILLFAFITALAFLGFPLSQLTILTGAFGVGLGFGLQTIINNFFSGLIVLFERPVQVGDIIEMDAMIGTVSRIGIRASIIRTPAGSEIIMPNSRLIAERVINWTLTDRCRGFEVSLTLAPTADTQGLLDLLEATAKRVEDIADNPEPVAQITAFSGANLSILLRAWTSKVEDWMEVRSRLAVALTRELGEKNIALK